MSKGAGSGDRLARGMARAQFMTTDGGITQDKWDQAFDDFDLEKFQNEPNKPSVREIEISDSDADSVEAGVSSAGVGTTEPGEPVTR